MSQDIPFLRKNRLSARCAKTALALLMTTGLAQIESSAKAQEIPTALRGHIPALVNRSRLQGRVDAKEQMCLAIALTLRNQPQLDALLPRIYTPGDPLYQRYLTPEQFAENFGPTQADYAAVSDYIRQQGLTILDTHPNRAFLDVSGSAQQVETAFHLHLMNYQTADNRVFRAPDAEPALPAAIANRVSAIIGLDTALVRRPHNIRRNENAADRQPRNGSGSGGGYAPADIKTAYNLQSVGLDGSGQTLAVFELDGYRASDITSYVNYFGLRAVPLQNVLLDGVSGRPGMNADEVTLDIELLNALAPGASKILVYETPNTDAGTIDCFNRIATDNLAKEISVSWGGSEDATSSSLLNSENTIFQQMATQGQSIFAAAGDSGAYDNGSTLSVDDPGSQLYMVSVGGTRLTMTGRAQPTSQKPPGTRAPSAAEAAEAASARSGLSPRGRLGPFPRGRGVPRRCAMSRMSR